MTYDDYVDQQDNLRPLRLFVGAASGLLAASDQTYVNQDAAAVNLPRQYYTIGASGASSIEGTPIAVSRTGAVVISPMVWLIGIGFAAAVFLKR